MANDEKMFLNVFVLFLYTYFLYIFDVVERRRSDKIKVQALRLPGLYVYAIVCTGLLARKGVLNVIFHPLVRV